MADLQIDNEPKDSSCNSTAQLINYARKKNIEDAVIFEGIEDYKEVLLNKFEWVQAKILMALCKNFSNAVGPNGLFVSGKEITIQQTSDFAILFFKIVPLSLAAKNAGSHFEKNISKSIKLNAILEKSRIITTFTPDSLSRYSEEICEFNKGVCYATIKLRGYKNIVFKETACVFRDNAPACRYEISWTPNSSILQKIKDFIFFRFRDQQAILSHMEESKSDLEKQYTQILSLNEELNKSLQEKQKLMDELRSLNSQLEQKVTDQTLDIRSKNQELTDANKKLSETVKTKDMLTGALVHDIKNHIFTISMDIGSLKHQMRDNPQVLGTLQRAWSSCLSASNLAVNMLDIGKIEEGKVACVPKPLNADKLTKMCESYKDHALFTEKNITITITPPPAPFTIHADEYMLDRIMGNLFNNAAMYTSDNGNVTITFKQPGIISVYNTSEPIPEEFRATLFEKYARVTTKSSKYSKGLGLFFCKLAMEAHNGAIKLITSDSGNEFVLEFRQ